MIFFFVWDFFIWLYCWSQFIILRTHNQPPIRNNFPFESWISSTPLQSVIGLRVDFRIFIRKGMLASSLKGSAGSLTFISLMLCCSLQGNVGAMRWKSVHALRLLGKQKLWQIAMLVSVRKFFNDSMVDVNGKFLFYDNGDLKGYRGEIESPHNLWICTVSPNKGHKRPIPQTLTILRIWKRATRLSLKICILERIEDHLYRE